ncbi:MAG: hypothetical protein FD124_220 [Alphaproteobacteria bacterium]|nr:MAG: hypothetical protein FD160_2959 [Caulobacteraceae bacterium]TPW08681.1 MAG: hypothetical protein FD124_220 [Alphaproteobacteria bacterium]
MTTEESEDAKMRALFGDASRPPMGDEDFVAAVMGRVEEVRASEKVRSSAFALGVIAVISAVLWPFKAAIATALVVPLTRYVPDTSMLGAGATAMLIAVTASAAALVYAERG